MKHRLIEKIADGLSSGRLRTVGRRAAGRLFALTLFGLAAAAAAPVTAMAALETQESAPEDVGGGAGADGDEVKLEYTVNEITGGDAYNDMMEQMGSDGRSDNVKVYQLTATAVGEDGEDTGETIDLTNCKVKVKLGEDPEEWKNLFDCEGTVVIDTDGERENRQVDRKKEGLLSVKIIPLGGNGVEKLIASGDVDLWDALKNGKDSFGTEEEKKHNLDLLNDWMNVEADLKFGEDNSIVYAVQIKRVNEIKLEEGKPLPFLHYIDVPAGQTMTIDLNGQTWTRNGGLQADRFPLVNVRSGGKLRVIDSVGNGGVELSNAQCVFNVQDDDPNEEPGEIIIEGGDQTVFKNSGGEHVIFTEDPILWGQRLRSKVKLAGGILEDTKIGQSTLTWRGGGILAGTVEMSGGVIKNNKAALGGGIYAHEVTIYGGTIQNNDSTEQGGGIWAEQIKLYGGTIVENTSNIAGGGIYTRSMLMTGGMISGNKVETGNENPRGGGGIYLDKNERVVVYGWPPYYDEVIQDGTEKILKRTSIPSNGELKLDLPGSIVYEAEGIEFNMHMTGGTVQNNESVHTGGGIFVNVGAVAHIRGMHGEKVRIEGNKALDAAEGHGFAGGGIFVEHPDNKAGDKGERGGKVYIYNAVITKNIADYGGGVAGCGSSKVDVFSVDGVAIYDNKLRGTTINYKKASVDLYADGSGTVDSMMMGGIQGSWSGMEARRALDPDDPEDTLSSEEYIDVNPVLNKGSKDFKHGFYLEAGGLTEKDKDRIEQTLATVIIKENESGSDGHESGGGGVGGNGSINLGFTDVEDKEYSLMLKKKVISQEENGETFKFEIEFFKDENGINSPVKDIPYSVKDKNGDVKSGDTGTGNTGNEGKCEIDLGNGESFEIGNLPAGTRYKITELLEGEQQNRYTTPSFKVEFKQSNGNSETQEVWSKGEITEGNETTGWIGSDTRVEFTNTAVYALPSTGGPGLKLYTMAGALCFMLGAGFMYRKNFRGRRV